MTSGFIDLHTHTTISDGLLSPEALLEEARWKGLSAIAVTDHDHVGGLVRAQAAGQQQGIEVVCGVELSCEWNGREVHILGLFIQPTPALLSALDAMLANRSERMQAMIDKFETMGFSLNMEDLSQEVGNSFGRPHLAHLLVSKGIVQSVPEAFARYIGDTGPAYVPKARWDVQTGIEMVQQASGLAILAHPGASGLQNAIGDFADFGLDGVEVYYPKHDPRTENQLLEECRRYDLCVSGGSDYHAHGAGVELGVPRIPYGVLSKLKERKGV